MKLSLSSFYLVCSFSEYSVLWCVCFNFVKIITLVKIHCNYLIFIAFNCTVFGKLCSLHLCSNSSHYIVS